MLLQGLSGRSVAVPGFFFCLFVCDIAEKLSVWFHSYLQNLLHGLYNVCMWLCDISDMHFPLNACEVSFSYYKVDCYLGLPEFIQGIKELLSVFEVRCCEKQE